MTLKECLEKLSKMDELYAGIILQMAHNTAIITNEKFPKVLSMVMEKIDLGEL